MNQYYCNHFHTVYCIFRSYPLPLFYEEKGVIPTGRNIYPCKDKVFSLQVEKILLAGRK